MLAFFFIEPTGEQNAETELEESDGSGDEAELQKRGNVVW